VGNSWEKAGKRGEPCPLKKKPFIGRRISYVRPDERLRQGSTSYKRKASAGCEKGEKTLFKRKRGLRTVQRKHQKKRGMSWGKLRLKRGGLGDSLNDETGWFQGCISPLKWEKGGCSLKKS